MLPAKRKIPVRFLPLALLAFLPAQCIRAQESSSRPIANASSAAASAPGSPTAALRDAISAACSQSEQAFAKSLTARNADTFAHLTPSARVAFMKRFPRAVPSCIARLLAEPPNCKSAARKPPTISLSSPWKCAMPRTPSATAPCASKWALFAKTASEKIAEAIEAFRRTYARLPDSLGKLAPPKTGAAANPDAAGLLDADLAAGVRNGYKFRYVISGGSTLGAPAKYEIAATPETYGRTGRRSFFRDVNGGLHGADRQGAVGSEIDPRVE